MEHQHNLLALVVLSIILTSSHAVRLSKADVLREGTLFDNLMINVTIKSLGDITQPSDSSSNASTVKMIENFEKSQLEKVKKAFKNSAKPAINIKADDIDIIRSISRRSSLIPFNFSQVPTKAANERVPSTNRGRLTLPSEAYSMTRPGETFIVQRNYRDNQTNTSHPSTTIIPAKASKHWTLHLKSDFKSDQNSDYHLKIGNHLNRLKKNMLLQDIENTNPKSQIVKESTRIGNIIPSVSTNLNNYKVLKKYAILNFPSANARKSISSLLSSNGSSSVSTLATGAKDEHPVSEVNETSSKENNNLGNLSRSTEEVGSYRVKSDPEFSNVTGSARIQADSNYHIYLEPSITADPSSQRLTIAETRQDKELARISNLPENTTAKIGLVGNSSIRNEKVGVKTDDAISDRSNFFSKILMISNLSLDDVENKNNDKLTLTSKAEVDNYNGIKGAADRLSLSYQERSGRRIELWNPRVILTSSSIGVQDKTNTRDEFFQYPFVTGQLRQPETEYNTSTVVDHGDRRALEFENSTPLSLNQWPVKHSAIIEGDLVLGGLMMVHEREDSVTCGPVMPQGGIQALEAMLYTLDWLNEHEIVPGVKIGAHILDDCDKDTYGLEMAVDFIKVPRYWLENPATHHGIRHSERWLRSIDGTILHGVHQINWPVKKEAEVKGDVILGGLMMVHEREESVTCGPVMAQGGVQALEAMLYTLDWINDNEIVPGVKIGAHILDDCDTDTYGLEMAVDFIKGSISNIDGAEYNCNKTAVRKVISGVVGAASSVTSIQVANLLRLFRIPQVSFFSTSPELSNKQRFEYFTRTIPSDHYQVKAMVDIVKKMGWSYVSIIYEESNYGIKAYEELEELLAKHQICIAIKEKLVKDSGVAEEVAYDNIVQKLLTKPRARGCIIFGSDQEVAGVMRAVRRNNATGAFYWIGSDGWSARGLVSNKNEPEVEGTLSVQPQANPVEGFEKYFLNLTVENNLRNPWFVEFWEDHFQCRYPNAPPTPYNQKYTAACTTKERLTMQNTAFEDQLQFVSDAVMAFAYAFRDMHADLCHGRVGLCEAMKPAKGTELLQYLRKVKFQGLSGDQFHFDKNGDGPARYNIIHFKQVSTGQYKWVRVGKYLEGELRLNMSEIQFRLDNPQPPKSVCSLPCRVGQAKKYVEGESCCWHCFDCTQYQIRHFTDQTRCMQCPQGTVPDKTHSYCRDIPEEFLKPGSGWAIGAMSFSASGILVTLFVGGVFVKHHDTPIVRASGRELSYVLLTGILMCYLVTFTLIFKPTDIVCGIQRFSAGFCFTVVYAALLTKTNRISRIFNKSKKSAKRPSFISPRSQLIICSLLVGVQILINAVWMVIDPAKARHHYPTREDNLLVCNSYIDASYMIAFTYPIILIVVCTVYAILTRKIPEDFNESKHIGFTMYTTCVIWLAFVPLYFGTGNHVALRITSMSVTISLSASVTIACLFSPKLYIILIHPERNIRHTRGPFAPKPSTISKTNASSMISTVTLTAVTCDQNKVVREHAIVTADCSTQSELFEMEMADRKNGKLPLSSTRSTQTVAKSDQEIVISPAINDIKLNEPLRSAKSLDNTTKLENGPSKNKKDVSL